MNPIKILFFLLSIIFVLFFWITVLTTLYKEDENKWKAALGLVTLLTVSLCLYLSYYIPYSIYWLMVNWDWRW